MARPSVDAGDDGGTWRRMRVAIATLVLVAIVLGTAAILSGYAGLGLGVLDDREAEVALEPAVLHTSDLDGGVPVVVGVVDEEGEPIEAGRIRVESGSARLLEPRTAPIGTGTDAWRERGGDPADLAANEVGLVFDDGLAIGPHENHGTLVVHVVPTEDADYEDEHDNAAIEVIDA